MSQRNDARESVREIGIIVIVTIEEMEKETETENEEETGKAQHLFPTISDILDPIPHTRKTKNLVEDQHLFAHLRHALEGEAARGDAPESLLPEVVVEAEAAVHGTVIWTRRGSSEDGWIKGHRPRVWGSGRRGGRVRTAGSRF